MNENKSGLCTAAMVLGIICVATFLIPCVGFLPGLLALIFSIVCLAKKKKPVGKARAGLITSIIGIVLGFISTTIGIIIISVLGISIGGLFAGISAAANSLQNGNVNPNDIINIIDNLSNYDYNNMDEEDFLNIFDGTDYEDMFSFDEDGNLIYDPDDLSDYFDDNNDINWNNFDGDDYDWDQYNYNDDDYNDDDYDYDYDYDYDSNDYDYEYVLQSGNIQFEEISGLGYRLEMRDEDSEQPYSAYLKDGAEYYFPNSVYDDYTEYGDDRLSSFHDWMAYWSDDPNVKMVGYSDKLLNFNDEWEYGMCEYYYEYEDGEEHQYVVFAYSKQTNDYAILLLMASDYDDASEVADLISLMNYMHVVY